MSYNLNGDTMTKENLLTFIYPYIIINEIDPPNSKDDIQRIIDSNLEEIIKTYIRFLPQESIRSLREIIAEDYDDIIFEDSVNTYNILRKQNIITTDYDENKKTLEQTLKKLLTDRKEFLQFYISFQEFTDYKINKFPYLTVKPKTHQLERVNYQLKDSDIELFNTLKTDSLSSELSLATCIFSLSGNSTRPFELGGFFADALANTIESAT